MACVSAKAQRARRWTGALPRANPVKLVTPTVNALEALAAANVLSPLKPNVNTALATLNALLLPKPDMNALLAAANALLLPKTRRRHTVACRPVVGGA